MTFPKRALWCYWTTPAAPHDPIWFLTHILMVLFEEIRISRLDNWMKTRNDRVILDTKEIPYEIY